MKKYIVEFIGSFFLVLTVCTAGALGTAASLLAVGAALMVMVYAGGHVSGGHYNPAVTLGVYLRGGFKKEDVLPYWAAQFAGALAAVVAVCILKERNVFDITGGGIHWLPVIFGDFLGTFALVWVVLNVATAKGTAGNSFYGLAIGFTVFVCAVAFGGAFNPAVAFGLFLKGAGIQALIAMLLGEVLGAALAATAFKAVNNET
ncbi:MAG: aquaporin [Opitutaceae bacterium]|jgi:aquaporin Z|nr:aquaporin [Opitutaceae bacterium]